MATRGALHSVVFPVCLCASVLLFLFLFFFSLFFCLFFLVVLFFCGVFFLLLISYLLALHSRLLPASPGFCSPGSCMCVFSVVLQFEASARLARLLLAGVVHVCFFCCPTIRSFGPPRPASARRGRACVFFSLSYNSKLRPASPGFCWPGSCMCVFSVVLQFEASARLARLLLARVVSVCFCCCPSIRGSAHGARLLLAGVVVPTCCLVVPFLFCSVPDRSFSWGCWGRLCFSQWSPRLVRAHRFLAASLGPGEQWRGPHVAPVASVPRGDAGRFRYLWGLGSGR